MIQQDIERAKTILDKPYPVGGTPITRHLREVENKKISDFTFHDFFCSVDLIVLLFFVIHKKTSV